MYIFRSQAYNSFPLENPHSPHLMPINGIDQELKDGKKDSCLQGSLPKYLTLVTKKTLPFPSA